MDNGFDITISHSLSPISRGQRGNLVYNSDNGTSEDKTSITNASVFLGIPSNRSSSENRLLLDWFAFYIAILAFRASRFDYRPYPCALCNGLGVVLNAPSGCTHAGVLGA